MENICHSFVHFSCEEMGCDTEFHFSLSPKIKKEYSPTKLVTCVLSCHCERLHTHTTTFPPVGLVLSRDQKFVHNFQSLPSQTVKDVYERSLSSKKKNQSLEQPNTKRVLNIPL